MTLQEALISLGDKPLGTSPFSAAIRALVLAQMGKKGSTITKDTPGYIVLSQVYKIPNEAKRLQLLEHQLGVVRSTDLYKQIVLLGSGLLAVVVVIGAMAVAYSDATISPELTEVLKLVTTETFSLLRFVIGLFFGKTDDLPPAP